MKPTKAQTIRFRTTNDQRRDLRDAAIRARLTLSEFARRALATAALSEYRGDPSLVDCTSAQPHASQGANGR